MLSALGPAEPGFAELQMMKNQACWCAISDMLLHWASTSTAWLLRIVMRMMNKKSLDNDVLQCMLSNQSNTASTAYSAAALAYAANLRTSQQVV